MKWYFEAISPFFDKSLKYERKAPANADVEALVDAVAEEAACDFLTAAKGNITFTEIIETLEVRVHRKED